MIQETTVNEVSQPSLAPAKPVELRNRILGIDQMVPLLDGQLVPYVNLDNAASTPPLPPV